MSELKLSTEEISQLWFEAQDQALAGFPAPFHFAKAVIELQARRTQPEATKPAQDLGAAILALPLPNTTLTAEVAGYKVPVYGAQHMRDFAMAALASPADALVAGDRVDAERFHMDHGQWHDRVTGQHMWTQDQYDEQRRDSYSMGKNDALLKISDYLRHLPDCGSWVKEVDEYNSDDMWIGTVKVNRPCTCGLDAAIQAQKDGHANNNADPA